MSTYATIGFRADTKGLIQVEKALDDVTNASYKADKATDALSDSQRKAANSAKQQSDANKKMAGTMGNMRGVAQQFGWQLQDVAVQLQAGVSGMTVFTQQGSQMAAAFGPTGAIVGAVLAVGGALGGAFLSSMMGAADATETLIDRVKALRLEQDKLNSALRQGMAIEFADAEREREEQLEKLQQRMESLLNLQKRFDEQASGGSRGGGPSGVSPMGQTQFDVDFIGVERMEEATKEIAILDGRIEALKLEAAEARDEFQNLAYGFGETEDRTKKMKTAIDNMVDSLKEQAARIGETERATALRLAASANAQKSDIEAINTAYDAIEAEEARIKSAKDQAKVMQTLERQRRSTLSAIDKANKKMEAQRAAQENYAQSLADAIDPMAAFERSVDDMWEAFNRGDLQDITENQLQAYIDKLREAAEAGQDIGFSWDKTFSAVYDGLSKVQSTMADGSKEAQKLGQAMQALQIVQGISAILNQGMGDPYTAIGRMAAMAAAVASLIGSVGFAGEGSTAAADAQASQGTGTVFGDPLAQSESLTNSVEITADASKKLVDLNTDMRDSLRAMQMGLGSAAGLILRGGNALPGAGESMGFEETIAREYSRRTSGLINDEWLQAMANPLEALFGLDIHFLDDIMGGSSDVINEGVRILGGSISDLMNNVMLEAFQDVESKKHFLDDKDVRRFTEALGGEVGQQFALVFASMVDTVTAAADVLGVDAAAAISRFQIQATEISLMDLTGEEQQAQLEAVFSQIFDRLASSVIPFAGDFAVAGEGMAETLVRVATQIQVADNYMGQLGNTLLEGLSGQALAQMSDDLIQAAGGLENFMSSMGNFVDTFATDEHKLTVATNAINSAFNQMGFVVPETRDGVWALMQTLTDPAQIARLAEITDALDYYYDALDKKAEAERRSAQQTVALAEAELQLAETRYAESQQATNDVLNALRRAVSGEQERVSALFDARIQKANEALEQTSDGIARFISRTQENIGELNSLANALAQSSASNRIISDATTRTQRQAAMDLISGAVGRNIGASEIEGLTSAAGVLQRGVSGLFTDESQANIAAAQAAFALNAVSERAGMQASAAERTVSALQARNESAQAQHAELIERLEFDRDSQLSALERIYTDSESMVNTMRGVEELNLSIDDSLRMLNENMAAEETAREQLEVQKQLVEQQKAMLDRLENMENRLADGNEKNLNELKYQTEELTTLVDQGAAQ